MDLVVIWTARCTSTKNLLFTRCGIAVSFYSSLLRRSPAVRDLLSVRQSVSLTFSHPKSTDVLFVSIECDSFTPLTYANAVLRHFQTSPSWLVTTSTWIVESQRRRQQLLLGTNAGALNSVSHYNRTEVIAVWRWTLMTSSQPVMTKQSVYQ